MTTSNYTPGPWKLAAGRLIETTSGGFTIGREGWTGTPVELDANARLVAAAPELLEALEQAERVIRYAAQESAGKVRKEIVGGWRHHAAQIRAFIEARA